MNADWLIIQKFETALISQSDLSSICQANKFHPQFLAFLKQKDEFEIDLTSQNFFNFSKQLSRYILTTDQAIFHLESNKLMQPVPAQTLSALEAKIAAKEQTNLQIFQKEILAELKAIREALVAESQAIPQAKAPTGEDEKDKKIAQLETENRRLNYRITHLTRNLQAALTK